MKDFTLVGVDGNAFAIIGYVKKAMKEMRLTNEEISSYQKEAMSGDYNKLLCISMDVIEILNDFLNNPEIERGIYGKNE
jgi:hypothetical protein